MKIVLLALALLLFTPSLASGATGQASRSMVVEPSIARIAAQIAAGAVGNAVAEAKIHGRGVGRAGGLNSIGNIWIDGVKREGPLPYLVAIYKIAGFVFDTRTAGSVQLDHVIRVRGKSVRLTETVKDGWVQIVARANIVDSVSNKRIPTAIRLVITARESNGLTYLSAVATGTADLSAFRCRLVRRIASRVAPGEISKSLDRELLAVLQRGGKRLYADGDLWNIVAEFVERVESRGLIR